MAIADVVNAPQRDKVENLPEQLFVLAHQAWLDADGSLRSGQVSFFLGDAYVLSFHDGPDDIFEPVRQRARDPRSKLSRQGADYLLYTMLDTLIDHYYPLIEGLADAIDDLQEEIFTTSTSTRHQEMFEVRRSLVTMRRRVWPLREIASALIRDDSDRLGEVAEQHLRDCFDHATVLLEVVDSQRELLTTLAEAHLTMVSQRTNEVMKVLTMIATVFIPLSFLAGVYGMNFEREGRPWNLPELSFPYGYPTFWGASLALAAVMLWLFRRKRWI
jgi:magnesium transporter